MFEPAGFAGEFARAVGYQRRNGHRKFFMLLLEFVSFYHLQRQTRIYDASIVLAVIPAMVATNAPASVQRVFFTLTVIK